MAMSRWDCPGASCSGFCALPPVPRSFPGRWIRMPRSWLSLDSTRVVREKDEHWDVLRLLLAEAGTAANLATDAHLAALAISHGAVLVSCDRDFARFKGLRWENPIGW